MGFTSGQHDTDGKAYCVATEMDLGGEATA